jgi:L-2-hydroxycarboxylate dehydrogenase (NAD+)
LLHHGLSEHDAGVVAATILDAELTGRTSHGLVHLPRLVDVLKTSKGDSLRVEIDTDTNALIDGGSSLGPVVANFAMEVGLSKVAKRGFAIVGAHTKDPFLHASMYTRMAADRGYVSLVLSNSKSRIPPYGSMTPVFGVNPLSVGFPCKPYPIIVDFAVSRITVSDVNEAARSGERLPEGVAIDSEGQPTSDPTQALGGALLPVDDQKGAALALVVELLAGPLVNAKAGARIKRGRGFLFLLIDPSIFVSATQFEDDMRSIIDEIKASHPLPGVDEVFYPGEQSARRRELALREGVEVRVETLDAIDKLLA